MERTRPLILVADDDQDILELVRLRLHRSGYETVLARDGTSALEAARAHHPDLAVLDVTMPGLTGYAVLEQLRSNPATKGIPVILLTARAQPRDVATGFESGADDYITKPFSPQELQIQVATLLASDRARITPLRQADGASDPALAAPSPDKPR
jgi:DNA-binding response OmpR family regulator